MDDTHLKIAVDAIHEAALSIIDYMNAEGIEPEDEEAVFYTSQVNKLRDCADVLSPPDDCWPQGKDGKGEVIPIIGYRRTCPL